MADRLDLDEILESGLDSVKKGDWKKALTEFERGLSLYEKNGGESRLIANLLSESKQPAIKVNGEPTDVSDGVNRIRRIRATEQALLEFAAFTSFIVGDRSKAELYLERVYGMQSVVWGASWVELIPKLHDLYANGMKRAESDGFGYYDLAAGELLLAADDERGIEALASASRLLPKNPVPSARLASLFVIKGNPERARQEALRSLAIDPGQVKVLIDLASSEWMLDSLDNAKAAAEKARELDPDLPGPYGFLALFALEDGEVQSAVGFAKESVTQSERHSYYLTILAVAYKAAGNDKEAQEIISQAFENDGPDIEFFRRWFFRGRSLELLRQLIESK